MLKTILTFISLAEQALEHGVPPQRIGEIDILRRLQRMGEEIGEDEIDKFNELRSSLESAMADLIKADSHAA